MDQSECVIHFSLFFTNDVNKFLTFPHKYDAEILKNRTAAAHFPVDLMDTDKDAVKISVGEKPRTKTIPKINAELSYIEFIKTL